MIDGKEDCELTGSNIMKTKSRRPKRLAPQFSPTLHPVNFPVRRCSGEREAATKRFLIIRVGAHGDILMATPLLAALRTHYPQAHVTWLVEYNERDAIEANPYVDEVLLWDSGYFKRFLRRGFYPLWLLRVLQLRTELRRRRYDVLISFQPEEWPLLLKGAAARINIGVFDTFRQFLGKTKTSRYARLYTHSFTYSSLPAHRTDQYLLPLKALDLPVPADKRMQMGFLAEDDAAVTAFLEEQGLRPGVPFVVLAPMTTWSSRCWPADRYAQLGDELWAREGCQIVIIGSAKEKERAAVEHIAGMMRKEPIRASGALSFRQMAALIARSSVLISGDTGPMHVAAAVGTPYVALFGPTPVSSRAPLAGQGLSLMHPVPCGPCDKEHCLNTGEDFMRCMKLLTVDEVYEAASALLGSPKKSHEYSHH